MNNPKIIVDTKALVKAHEQAESFATALSLMCALSLKDADPEKNREAINEAQSLVAEAIAVYIAFAYMTDKAVALADMPDAEKNEALLTIAEGCLTHQKMRAILLPFVEGKCQMAWRAAGKDGPQGPSRFN
jgi:hypothetical protein